MNKKLDSRKRRTRSYLRMALSNSLKAKDISDITINDLIDDAQISRGTFYLHYKDLDDFIKTAIDDTLADMFNKINSVTKLDDHTTFVIRNIAMLEYIAQDADFFSGMLGENGPKAFQKRWNDLAFQHFQDKYHSLALQDTRYMFILAHKDIFGAYNISAQLETIKFWLLGGMKYSPAFLAKLLAEMRNNSLESILKILKI